MTKVLATAHIMSYWLCNSVEGHLITVSTGCWSVNATYIRGSQR